MRKNFENPNKILEKVSNKSTSSAHFWIKPSDNQYTQRAGDYQKPSYTSMVDYALTKFREMQRSVSEAQASSINECIQWSRQCLNGNLEALSKLASTVLDKKFTPNSLLRAGIYTFTAAAVLNRPFVEAASGNASNSALMITGDSVAYGISEHFPSDSIQGYGEDLDKIKARWNITDIVNKAVPGENTTTYQYGGAEVFGFQFPTRNLSESNRPQIDNALKFIENNNVKFLLFQLGANNILEAVTLNPNETCTINETMYNQGMDIARQDLPGIGKQLRAAIDQNGGGDFLVINYYNPYQKMCPETIPYVQQFNNLLANFTKDHATMLVDIQPLFTNDNMCDYTWICDKNPPGDPHPKHEGYQAIANKTADDIDGLIKEREQNQPKPTQEPHKQASRSDNKKPLVIGLSVGLGVPAVVMIGGAIYMYKRRESTQGNAGRVTEGG